MPNRLLLINGPNLNIQREKAVYGDFSLEVLETKLHTFVDAFHFSLDCFQSNHEGELIECLHKANGNYTGIIFNPAAYSHTSIALRDAIEAIDTPVIEVHLSHIYKREVFRHTSVVAPVCIGQVSGLGMQGYQLAAMSFMDTTF